jgi:hypothetical protein
MLAIAEPRAKPKAECFYRPYGTDLPFTSFPSTSYWATFTESLRDKSPHHTILALKLTRMGSRQIAARSTAFPNLNPSARQRVLHSFSAGGSVAGGGRRIRSSRSLLRLPDSSHCNQLYLAIRK